MNAVNQSYSSTEQELHFPKLPSLELNQFLVPHPLSSLFIRAVGDVMAGAGIVHDDMLVVDRAQEPQSGNLVVVQLPAGLTLCRLLDDGVCRQFQQESANGSTCLVEMEGENKVFGVVNWVLHQT